MKHPIEQGKVLIVDDVELNRILARAYLESLGWSVDEAVNGFAALAYFRTCMPEYILLDVRMPGMDGVGVAKTVRHAYPVGTVKIVGYTAHAIPGELVHIRTAGFDEILVKPVSLSDFENVFGHSSSRPHQVIYCS